MTGGTLQIGNGGTTGTIGSGDATVAAGATLEGSGLGLAIVRQIARAHGGDVAFTPGEGGGSRFTVTLPIGHE